MTDLLTLIQVDMAINFQILEILFIGVIFLRENTL